MPLMIVARHPGSRFSSPLTHVSKSACGVAYA